ncbi:hypothetical protein ACWGIU_00280 [Streptomyces sp. NPDC054840]
MKWRWDRQHRTQKGFGGAEAPESRVLRHWGLQGVEWWPWLRRSPVAVDLLAWWGHADAYRALVGEDAYRERGRELLSRASPRDCAAAGMGCERRIDRACRTPEICALEPAAPGRREGPAPGACSGFYGDTWLRVRFSPDDRHCAVSCREDEKWASRLWVDGVQVEADVALDFGGHWQGNRFYVVQAMGPDDHPMQRWGPGGGWIASLLIHDIERGASRLLVPEDTEAWTDPLVVLTGDELRVYADRAAHDADEPGRVLRLGEAVADDGTEPGTDGY